MKDGVVSTKGKVDEEDEKWTVALQGDGAVKDYFSYSPESEDAKLMFEKKSKDGSGKVFADVTGGENPVVTWTNGTTTEKELEHIVVKLA